MSTTTLLLIVIAIQQGLFTVAWAVVWSLRMAPRAAPSFMFSTLAIAAAMALLATLAPAMWPGFVLANLLGVACVLAFRRGLQAFASQTTSVRNDIGILVGAILLQGYAIHFDSVVMRTFFMHAVSMPLTFHAAWIVIRHMQREFGVGPSWLFATPLLLMGTIQTMQLTALVAEPLAGIVVLPGANAFDIYFTLAIMGVALLMNLVFLSIVVTRVVRRLDGMTRHDAMTGLLNRRAIEESLRRHISRAKRRRNRFALLALDIDHFKRINDAHGHPAGDAVLVALGHTLNEFARTGDLVARVGGEEFWILAPDTDTEGAMALAERVRLGVKRHTIHVGKVDLDITTSIGVAVYDTADEGAKAFCMRADQALYAAKAGGRNRAELAPAMIETKLDAPRRSKRTGSRLPATETSQSNA